MDKRKQEMHMNLVGGSSLMVIFIVLCLIVFALLGLSTVQADKRLQDISIEAVEKYYAADSQAEQILARLRGGEIPEGVTSRDGIYSYQCPMSQTQTLQVRVRASDWKVLTWKLVSTVEWEPEDSLTVWDGT